MPGRLGPRFALEAAFLILLAVGAGLADLSPTVIVLVMVAAWVIVAVIEFTAERLGTSFPPLRRTYVAPPPVRRRAEGDLVEATVVTPVPEPAPAKEDGPAEAEPPPPAPEAKPEAPVVAAEPEASPEPSKRRRFWQRREPEQVEEGEPAPPPRHVRLLPRRAESSRAVEEVAEIFDRSENGDDR
jgi:hypothetical protein